MITGGVGVGEDSCGSKLLLLMGRTHHARGLQGGGGRECYCGGNGP